MKEVMRKGKLFFTGLAAVLSAVAATPGHARAAPSRAAPALIPICAELSLTQCGLLDRQGHWAVEPAYSEILLRDDGWAVERDRQWGYLDADGKVRISPTLENIGSFHDGLAKSGSESVGNNEGYVDTQGHWAIPPKYFITQDFSEGLAAVSTWEGSSNGGHSECRYITPDGKSAFDGRWDNCESFHFGMASISGHGIETDPGYDSGSTALIDRKGHLLIPWGAYYSLKPIAPDRVQTSARDGGQSLLDGHGRVLFQVPADGNLGDVSQDRLFYTVASNDDKGLLDVRSGKPLVKPRHDWNYSAGFSDGVAWVSVEDPKLERPYVLIDLQGRVLLKARAYVDVKPFFGGAAPVSWLGENWRLIDRHGRALTEAVYAQIEPAWSTGPQSPVLGDVWRAERAEPKDVVDWIDAKGRVLASTRTLPCGITVVDDAQGKTIWPSDSKAYCWLASQAARENGWDVPPDAGVDEARVMAIRVAKARDSLAGWNGLQGVMNRFSHTTVTPEQKVLQAPWQVGPITLYLRDRVTLELPAGYRYLPAEYAQVVLDMLAGGQTQRDPQERKIPVALVADNDLHVLLHLYLMEQGHVATNEPLPSAAWLKDRVSDSLRFSAGDTLGLSPNVYVMHSVNWLLKPRWNATAHRLDWAFSDTSFDTRHSGDLSQPAFRRSYAVNSVLLGRTWAFVLGANFGGLSGDDRAVLTQDAINHIMPHVRFDPGHTYADATASDAPARLPLTGYITGSSATPSKEPAKRVDEATTQAQRVNRERFKDGVLVVVLLLLLAWLIHRFRTHY